MAALAALKARQQAAKEASASFLADNSRAQAGRPAAPAEDASDDEDAPAAVQVEPMEEEAMQHEDLRAAFPMSFGQQEKKALALQAVHAKFERTEPPDPAGAAAPHHDAAAAQQQLLGAAEAQPAANGAEAADVMGPDDGEDVEEDPYQLPITHEASLQSVGKLVCALDVEHSGQRVIAGNKGYSVHMFDFNGMKTDMRSFRSLEPHDGHPVHALSWSPTGDAFMAITGSAKVKVYDRDGRERGETTQGDMYIRDMRNTKGHVSPCTNGQWHPADRYSGMTSSEDGTIRVWDTWNCLQKTVVKPKLARPGRVSVTCCRYGRDGQVIVGGLADGTLQLWDVRGKFGHAASTGVVAPPKAQMIAKQDWSYQSGGGQLVRNAHTPDTEITGMAFARDGTGFATRGADETLKLWEVRNLKAPVHVFDGLPTNHSETGCCYSPDGKLLLTGTSAPQAGAPAALLFFDIAKQQLVQRVTMPTSVVAVQWHERTNQILLGTGDRTAGCVRVLYNPSRSEGGVLRCAARKPREKDPLDFEAPLVVHAPHALPMFKEERYQRKRKSERDRDDAVKYKRPEEGAAVSKLGRGAGGVIGRTGGTLLTQYVLKTQGLLKNPGEEDIRSAILRHGDAATKEFAAHTKAYAKTQPNRVFAVEEDQEQPAEEDDAEEQQ